jgi:prepilin-type N-terminal cleavage/methylation domain-containing protein
MWELGMQKLNKNKGFSLIEQLCAISIFSIISICVITIQLNNLRLKDYNSQILIYSSVLEALKQEMLKNNSYDNILQIYNLNKRFVSKEMLNMNSIRENNLNQIFCESANTQNTYLILNLTQGEILNIHMELHVKLNYKEEIIVCDFIKGNYI